MSVYYSKFYSDVSPSVHHFSYPKMYTLVGVQLPHPLIKYLAGLLYLCLSLTGLALNILWGVILYLGHRHFSRLPFYIVSRHLMVSDILCVIGQLAIAAPLSFMDYKTGLVYRRTTFFNYFATLETVGRFATLIFVFLQAMSQITPFMPNYTRLARQLSNSGSFICMLGWLVNVGLMIWFLASKCHKDFSLRYFKFLYECSRDKDAAETMWACIYVLTITVITIGLCIYGIGLRTLQKSIKLTKTFTSMEIMQQREFCELKRVRLLLFQGLFIVLMTLLRTLAFAIIPDLAENLSLNMKATINVVANCIELVSSSVHPLIYILFNERAYKLFKKILTILMRKEVDDPENVDVIMGDNNSVINTP